jgi:hypothetical protein
MHDFAQIVRETRSMESEKVDENVAEDAHCNGNSAH